jgi:hypothetical protein
MASSELSVSHQIKARRWQLYGRVYACVARACRVVMVEEEESEGGEWKGWCCWLVDVVDV